VHSLQVLVNKNTKLRSARKQKETNGQKTGVLAAVLAPADDSWSAEQVRTALLESLD
jgi:hypothetical protein